MEPALGLDPRDSWGRRREPNGNDDPVLTGSISSQTTRGYTGQEELADISLVHFNGRVYDPLVGRFTSGDPTVQYPTSSQGWNRYAYVGNNPLAFADPSGYGFFSFLSHIFNPVQVFEDQVSVLRAIYSVPYLGQIISAAGIAASGATCGPCAIGVAAVSSAVQTGVEGGSLDQALESGLIAGATAAAFYGVGAATYGDFGDNGWGYTSNIWGQTPAQYYGSGFFAENVAGHLAVGCASAAASGGGCGPGALAAGLSAGAGPELATFNIAEGTAASAVIGGIGSVAGGGKFENGAITGAFGYLFNTVGLACHDVVAGAASHCGLFVFSSGAVSDDPSTSDYFSQFSLGYGDTTFNQTPSTSQNDFLNFENGNFTVVPPPVGMNQQDFDQAVINYAQSYKAPYYDALAGPNSNSAAGFPILKAGGTPAVPPSSLLGPIRLNYWQSHTYP